MNELIATCSVALPGGSPKRVHLLPFGTNMGSNGRGPYILRDKVHAAQVIANTTAYQRRADLPVDYEHQNQLAPHLKPKPAAGWINPGSLVVGPNGIWGEAEWTEIAAQNISAREYRYFSPVFTHDQQGNVIRIVGGALTHFPNLELTALASQGATMPGDTMTSAKALLGLDGADDATFLKCCGDIAKLTKAFITHLGLSADTGAAGVLDALMQKANKPPATATASQTPEVLAAVEAIQAVASQAQAYRDQLSQAQVDKAVSDAMDAGKVSPAMRDWAIALASQSPDAFQGFLKTMPPVFSELLKSDFSHRQVAHPANGDSSGLNAGQLAVCSQMGMSPEDYRKNLEG